MYSDEQMMRYLKIINWDTPIPNEELLALLKGEKSGKYEAFRKNLYMKLLNGYSWHKVRHMIPPERLREVLADDVIKGLFPRNLREKYKYVQSLL